MIRNAIVANTKIITDFHVVGGNNFNGLRSLSDDHVNLLNSCLYKTFGGRKHHNVLKVYFA